MSVPTTVAVAIVEQVERVGSYFGFAAVIGLGVLSLLYFAQAREVKRLREWAGRSRERDDELARRAQSDAQRRVVAQPASPRPAVQPGSPQTAAAQQAEAARTAAAVAQLGQAGPAGPVAGPPGQLHRPAAAAGTGGAPAPGSVAAAAAAAAPPANPAAPGQPAGAPASTAAEPGAIANTFPSPAATAGAAAAAARQAGPPERTPAFANGSSGQDTHESAAARPSPLPDLPRAPRAVTPAASRLSDDDRSRRGPRIGLVAGGVGGVIAVGIVLVLLLTGGSDTPPADNEIGGTTPPPAAASPPTPSSTKVDRKATQVAVLNGTTQTGLARNVGNKLESSGFTILSVGDNSDQQIAATTISYAAGSEKAARVVAQIMEVATSAVMPIDINTSASVAPEAKVVVIVGSDRSSTG